jgi:hypothetical protein
MIVGAALRGRPFAPYTNDWGGHGVPPLQSAAALEEYRVAPDAIQLRNTLALPDFTKSAFQVQLNARDVLREYRCLKCPYAGLF